MDWNLILGGAFTVVCALIAAVYKNPKCYEMLIKPVLLRVAGWVFLISIGSLIGYMAVSNALLEFVDPARLEAARKATDEIQVAGYFGQLCGVLIWLLNIGLWVLADKAEKLKEN